MHGRLKNEVTGDEKYNNLMTWLKYVLKLLLLLFQFIDYLQNESLYIEVWGRQKGKKLGSSSTAPKAVSNIILHCKQLL